MLPVPFESALRTLSGGSVHDHRYLLAVSGGVDSMCMADLFLRSSQHPRFAVAHVNFSLRGDESDADERLVWRWADEHGLKFHTARFDTAEYAREHSVSVEMAARELRYRWFGELMDEFGYDLLAVAHNRNDSVETLFLNILRGTGIKGLSGIRPVAGRIIRPLLKVSRDEISEYVRAGSVPFRVDRTNLETDYARNRIRNAVFPEFSRVNPSFLNTVSRDMEYFAEADDILDGIFGKVEQEAVVKDGDAVLIRKAVLDAAGHRRYWLYRILSAYGFNSSQTEDIDAAVGQSGSVFHGHGYDLIVGRGELKVFPSGECVPRPLEISGPGVFTFGNISLRIRVFPRTEDFVPRPPSGVLYMDAAAFRFPLVCRCWQQADRFRPFGMKRGSRKLSDFFTGLKMDRREKSMQPVVCDATGRILCIPPLAIDDGMRIEKSASMVAEVTIIK